VALDVTNHAVTVVCDGEEVPGWKSYSIQTDVLQPADSFSMQVQFTRAAWSLLQPDSEITVHIDRTRILTGYIGTREKVPGTDGTMLSISGRDKTGRLVDESAPLFSYGGKYLKELAEDICDVGTDLALFERVVLVNTKNRSLLRSKRARKAKISLEPLVDPVVGGFRAGAGLAGISIPEVGTDLTFKIDRPPIIEPGIFRGRAASKRVQPGQTRWAVLEEFLREARLLAWSTADGRELFIGLPNYEQEAQYMFFEASSEDGRNRDVTNCSIRVVENVEEMYALYLACGAARGNGKNYGPNVTKNIASVKDNPETNDGTGIHFARPKTLLISDDGIKSQRDALERAERERLQREAGRLELEISCAGHGQIYAGDVPTIYAVDTIAEVYDEDTGIADSFYVTAVDFSADDSGGTRTSIRAVPKGTLLSL